MFEDLIVLKSIISNSVIFQRKIIVLNLLKCTKPPLCGKLYLFIYTLMFGTAHMHFKMPMSYFAKFLADKKTEDFSGRISFLLFSFNPMFRGVQRN